MKFINNYFKPLITGNLKLEKESKIQKEQKENKTEKKVNAAPNISTARASAKTLSTKMLEEYIQKQEASINLTINNAEETSAKSTNEEFKTDTKTLTNQIEGIQEELINENSLHSTGVEGLYSRKTPNYGTEFYTWNPETDSLEIVEPSVLENQCFLANKQVLENEFEGPDERGLYYKQENGKTEYYLFNPNSSDTFFGDLYKVNVENLPKLTKIPDDKYNEQVEKMQYKLEPTDTPYVYTITTKEYVNTDQGMDIAEVNYTFYWGFYKNDSAKEPHFCKAYQAPRNATFLANNSIIYRDGKFFMPVISGTEFRWKEIDISEYYANYMSA